MGKGQPQTDILFENLLQAVLLTQSYCSVLAEGGEGGEGEIQQLHFLDSSQLYWPPFVLFISLISLQYCSMQNYKLYSISSYSTLSISFKTGCSIQRDYLNFSLKRMIQKFPSILETLKKKMVSGFLKSPKSSGRKECTNRCFQHFGNKTQQTLIMPLALCTAVLQQTVEYNGII